MTKTTILKEDLLNNTFFLVRLTIHEIKLYASFFYMCYLFILLNNLKQE
ncbi:hypothetical protein F975_01326 [Acinetobacter sp. ANC 3789]|nr:hypothetical protein F975_01326 [Acinetobacter sp. ANC 3789]